MRHWLLYDNADPPRVTVIREPETAAQARKLGRYIEGPFVPVGDLPQIQRIRIFALTGISTGEYKEALAAIIEITGEALG